MRTHLRSLCFLALLGAMLTALPAAAAVESPEHWSGVNHSAGGLVTGDAYFAPGRFLKLPSQILALRSVKTMAFPAHLGFASGNVAHLYRITSGGMSVLPGGNYFCGGAAKTGVRPTYVIVTHDINKYQPGRQVEIGMYRGTAMPTGSTSDALCATVGYTSVR